MANCFALLLRVLPQLWALIIRLFVLSGTMIRACAAAAAFVASRLWKGMQLIPGLLLVAAKGLFAIIRFALRWIAISLIYLGSSASLLAVPVVTFPFLFIVAIFGLTKLLGAGNAHTTADLLSQLVFAGLTKVFVAAQDSLPSDCFSPSLLHAFHGGCFSPADAAARPLARFDTVFHAVFGFCVGFGIILDVGQVGRKQLLRLEKFLREAERVDPTLLVDDKGNPNPNFRRQRRAVARARFFKPFAKWSLWLATGCAYVCFIVTACIAGLMIATTAMSEDKLMPSEMVPAYLAFVTAPFLQAIILIAVVVAILVATRLFVRPTANLGKKVMAELSARQRRAAEFAPS
jgi:hypothetical protein